MAKIRDYAVTVYTVATASMVCEMPTHQSGDLLVAFVNKDTNTTFTTPSGWIPIRTGASTGSAGGVYTKRAASASETVTFALTIETCMAVLLSVTGNEAQIANTAVQINVVSGTGVFTRTSGDFTNDGFLVGQTVNFAGFANAGNNGPKILTAVGTTTVTTATAGLVTETGSGDETLTSTGIGESAFQGADDSTNPHGGVGLTTKFAKSLLLHGISFDAVTAPITMPPWIGVFGGDAGANALSVCYSVEPSASTAITAPDTWTQVADDGRGFMVEVIDGSSGGKLPAYIPRSTTPSSQISPLTGVGGTADVGAWIAANSTVITSVAGKTVTGLAVSATADSGINVFRSAATTAGSSSTTLLSHTEFDRTSTFDATALEGLVFGTQRGTAPRDWFDCGTALQGGKYILMGSTTANWRAWVVGGQGTKTDIPDARNNFLIEMGASDTIYASTGTPNYASLDYFTFGSSGYYGAPSVQWSMLWLLNVVELAGGGTSEPFGFDDLVQCVNKGTGDLPLIQQAGASGTLWCPLRFGGTQAIQVLCNLNTFQYPRKADETRYVNFHVSNNKIGIEFYGVGSGDSIKFTNCVFTSPSPYYWRFNASHSASATIDFTGSSVVNATVTLRSTSDLNRVTFIDCPSFTQNSATLTNCTFSNTKITSAAPADVTLISATNFTSAGTGYAIEVGGTAANITLTNVNFTGYAGSNGTTGNEALFVNIATGSMDINITGGNVPSIRTAGATVNIVAGSVNATLTAVTAAGVAVQSAQVLVVAATGGPLPFDVTVTISNSASTATVTHTAHGMATNDKVRIKGASHYQNNGVFTTTVTDANTYTYTMGSSPGSNPTGIIKSTYVVLSGTTDINGQISMSRVFPSDQPVSGWARKSTAQPYYKTGAISGSVDSAVNTSFSAVLIADE